MWLRRRLQAKLDMQQGTWEAFRCVTIAKVAKVAWSALRRRQRWANCAGPISHRAIAPPLLPQHHAKVFANSVLKASWIGLSLKIEAR